MGRERMQRNKKKKLSVGGSRRRRNEPRHARERLLKEELVKLTTSVRDKYKALKRDKDEMQRYFEATAKPIVTPLQRAVAESVKEAALVKTTTSPPSIKEESLKKEDQVDEETDDLNQTFDTSTQTDSLQYYLSKLSMPERDADLDLMYGVRPDGKGGTVIGDSKIIFTKNKIYVRQRSYDISEGLLELLFMQKPDKNLIDTSDLKSYKDILERTNAHRQMYSAEKPLNANRGKKYKSVISALFGPPQSHEASGKGLDHNDVNTLVNRLRVLILSQRAGHTAHDKEINRIVHYLRINNIIM